MLTESSKTARRAGSTDNSLPLGAGIYTLPVRGELSILRDVSIGCTALRVDGDAAANFYS
jgi:hypothetical protein